MAPLGFWQDKLGPIAWRLDNTFIFITCLLQTAEVYVGEHRSLLLAPVYPSVSLMIFNYSLTFLALNYWNRDKLEAVKTV